jgi:SAM-dependent methyltransferase
LVEWNINDPHHAPLKEYCLYRQMEMAMNLLPARIKPVRVLNVCCGSGLEAEFFSRRCNVPTIGMDISLGMLRNGVERAARHNFQFIPVCADSEDLPLRTGSVDLAVVLHGLHHLHDPRVGLLEMTRVAKSAICAFEPATSPIRELMMRLKLISRIEESGNVSYDFCEWSGFSQILRAAGFDGVAYRRALWSLRVSEWWITNVRPTRALAKGAFEWLNAGTGCRWGTKLSVVAWRGGD